jgi:hypothetical protein
LVTFNVPPETAAAATPMLFTSPLAVAFTYEPLYVKDWPGEIGLAKTNVPGEVNVPETPAVVDARLVVEEFAGNVSVRVTLYRGPIPVLVTVPVNPY